MCKVVVDRNAVDFTAHFHASLDVAKTPKRLDGNPDGYPGVARCRDCRQCVETVVATGQFPLDTPLTIAAEAHFKAAVTCLAADRPALITVKPLNRCPAAAFQHSVQAGLLAIGNDQAVARYRAHQMMKLRFDGREVGKDVCMVEFEIVQNRRARTVVNELGALVKKRRIVFVRLDHEESGVGHACGNAKIKRHPADEKARVEACAFENPRQHRTGCGLAMGAGKRQDPVLAQDVFRQPLWPGCVRQPAVQDFFH